MNLGERLKDRQQQIVSVDRAGAVLKMNFCCDQRYTSQENNLLNDYSAKMALGVFGKTMWRFFSYSIAYRAPPDMQRTLYLSNYFGTK